MSFGGDDHILSFDNDQERIAMASLLYYLHSGADLCVNGEQFKCSSEKLILEKLENLKRAVVRTRYGVNDTAFLLDSDECIASGLVSRVRECLGGTFPAQDDEDVKKAIEMMHNHFHPCGEEALDTRTYTEQPKTYEQVLGMVFIAAVQMDHFRMLPLRLSDGTFVVYACGVRRGTQPKKLRFCTVEFSSTMITSSGHRVFFDPGYGLGRLGHDDAVASDRFMEKWKKLSKSEKTGTAIRRLLIESVTAV